MKTICNTVFCLRSNIDHAVFHSLMTSHPGLINVTSFFLKKQLSIFLILKKVGPAILFTFSLTFTL
jgi:hypothetical protein